MADIMFECVLKVDVDEMYTPYIIEKLNRFHLGDDRELAVVRIGIVLTDVHSSLRLKL